MTTTAPVTPETGLDDGPPLESTVAAFETLVGIDALMANEVQLSAEDFRELMRLADHIASAPYNERYKQELAAFAASRGLTL